MLLFAFLLEKVTTKRRTHFFNARRAAQCGSHTLIVALAVTGDFIGA
jgi:hypothetical protein